MTESTPVSAHVSVLHGPDGGRYPHGNPVLVTGAEETVLIDSALGVRPPPADRVLVSHYHEDHVVGLAEPAYETWIHQRDLVGLRTRAGFVETSGFDQPLWLETLDEKFGYTPLPHAIGFGDDAVFDLGGVRVCAVPLPGHTAGHCGFLIEPDGVLYLADVDLSRFGPFYGDASGSLSETAGSLQRCADIEAAVYLTYHHKGPYEDRDSFLAALELHRSVLDRRSEQVLTLLDKPRSASEMVGSGVVYRPGTAPPFGPRAEERMCAQHLDELAASGAVEGPDAEGRYRRVGGSANDR